jgi:hypothetical protein
VFPDQGWWEITARAGKAQMKYVTLIVWVPFDPHAPGWMPQGFSLVDTDLSHYPDTIKFIFESVDRGRVEVVTSRTPIHEENLYRSSESVSVDGEPGTCFQPAGMQAAGKVLSWMDGGLQYQIKSKGVELSCSELSRIASLADR